MGMLKYVTSSEYEELLGAESIPDNFNNLVIEASSYINYQTTGRIVANNIPEEVKYATCLIINILNEETKELDKIKNLASQNIEGWSETYTSPEETKKNYANKKFNVLKTYLWNVYGVDNKPLLYRGVGVIG